MVLSNEGIDRTWRRKVINVSKDKIQIMKVIKLHKSNDSEIWTSTHYLESLLKHRFGGLSPILQTPKAYDSAVLGCCPNICISIKLTSEADAANPMTMLCI